MGKRALKARLIDGIIYVGLLWSAVGEKKTKADCDADGGGLSEV